MSRLKGLDQAQVRLRSTTKVEEVDDVACCHYTYYASHTVCGFVLFNIFILATPIKQTPAHEWGQLFERGSV